LVGKEVNNDLAIWKKLYSIIHRKGLRNRSRVRLPGLRKKIAFQKLYNYNSNLAVIPNKELIHYIILKLINLQLK
jgi:hypothetical protein